MVLIFEYLTNILLKFRFKNGYANYNIIVIFSDMLFWRSLHKPNRITNKCYYIVIKIYLSIIEFTILLKYSQITQKFITCKLH